MKNTFDMSDLGKTSYFLGLEIQQCEAGIYMSQKKYVENLLKNYNMLHCKPVNVPLLPCAKQQVYENAYAVDVTKYSTLIGKLMYMTYSIPDIMFSVSFLSRLMRKPTSIHQGAIENLLRYLSGTIEFLILYCKNYYDGVLQGFFDSDWGPNPVDRKSTSSVVFNMGSGAITWMSKT